MAKKPCRVISQSIIARAHLPLVAFQRSVTIPQPSHVRDYHEWILQDVAHLWMVRCQHLHTRCCCPKLDLVELDMKSQMRYLEQSVEQWEVELPSLSWQVGSVEVAFLGNRAHCP